MFASFTFESIETVVSLQVREFGVFTNTSETVLQLQLQLHYEMQYYYEKAA
jgi:hypothetical protein